MDDFGQNFEAGVYSTSDFERRLRLPGRTALMAAQLNAILGDRDDRAVVFCVDADHAADLVRELRNLRPDKTRADPEWACRIMTVERERERLLDSFTDPESNSPQVAVSTYLLSTGVDIQDLKYVVIARPVGSAAEFKQIIGRGARLYPDKDKTEFEIIDYVGATARFYDADFDGPPLKPASTEIVDDAGKAVLIDTGDRNAIDDVAIPLTVEDPGIGYSAGGRGDLPANLGSARQRARKVFQLTSIPIELTSEGYYVHDLESGRPRLVKFVDWVSETVLNAFDGPEALLAAWSDPDQRSGVMLMLQQRHIDLEHLAREAGGLAGRPIDTVDYLLQLAWGLPTRTRAQRAQRVREQYAADINQLSVTARQIMAALLDTYGESGVDEISTQSVVQVPPLSDIAQPVEIARAFGGPTRWHEARRRLQEWLYTG